MSRTPGPTIRHVISIGAPGESAPPGFELCGTRIRLEFFDVTGSELREYGPQPSDVEQVVKFAQAIQHEGGKLLVHCGAGISRSSAAALTVFAVWLGAGREQEAVNRIYAAQPHAWPNSLFVELADELLGRGGALITAVSKAVEALDVEELLRRYARRMGGG